MRRAEIVKGRYIDASGLDGEEGSLYSTEARGCPWGQLPAELRAAVPREDPARLFSCASLRPLGDVGVRGQLDPHGFPGTTPRVRVGKHSRKMRGDKGQGPCLAGPGAPPGPRSAPAEGPALPPPHRPRGQPAPGPPLRRPAFVPAGGQRRSLRKVLG